LLRKTANAGNGTQRSKANLSVVVIAITAGARLIQQIEVAILKFFSPLSGKCFSAQNIVEFVIQC
jgi:hypothetical protein